MRSLAVLFAIVLAVVRPVGISSQAALPSAQAWGPSTHGLRIGVSSVSAGPQRRADAEFYVAFENTGESDVVVNLGHMLANGKVIIPSAVYLTLTDPSGKTRELVFSDRQYGIVAGRIDDFTVALPKGSAYALRVSLNQYSSPATKEFELKLGAGRHRIAARFEGHGARAGNLDMEGVALLNFWKGTVQSNGLEFEVLKEAASK